MLTMVSIEGKGVVGLGEMMVEGSWGSVAGCSKLSSGVTAGNKLLLLL